MVEDGVEDTTRFEFAGRLQRLDVKGGHGAIAAVARQSSAELGHKYNSMNSWSIHQLSDRMELS
jgi:hypothetical protein